MPVRTRITSRGVIQEQVTENARGALAGHGPNSLSTNSLTVDSSPSAPGMYTVSGSTGSGIITVTLESPTLNPGSYWIFRATSADAHVLTGSGLSFTDGTNVGIDITLDATIGSSVALMSDGANYLVMANSGTLTLG